MRGIQRLLHNRPQWTQDPLWTRARAVPSLDLDFAGTGSLRDKVSGQELVTFTRASDATYVDSTGTVRKALTNLLVRSEEFDNASWAKAAATISANSITSPSGTLTGDKLVVNNGQTAGYVVQSTSFVSGAAYTISCYAKAGEVGDLRFVTQNVAIPSANAIFNLSTGSVTSFSAAAASISSVGNGWYRCVAVFNATATASDGIQIRSAYTGDGTSGIFIWGAQLVEGTDPGPYLPTGATVNGAPRIQWENGIPRGLLVEEARTNSIRNNTMVGAVAGTPGTLPTNWNQANTTGVTTSVVSTGTERGIAYIDIRANGTPSSSGTVFVSFDSATATAAASGQAWTNSIYLAIPSGSLTNITSPVNRLIERAAAGAYVAESISSFASLSNTALDPAIRNVVIRSSLGGTAQFVNSGISFNVTAGAAIDITLRIGLPQLELGAFVTSPILTSGTAATRAADVATGTSGVNFNALRTLYVEFASPASGTRGILSLNDNTANERLALNTSTADPLAVCVDGGVTQASLDAGTVTANQMSKFAARFNTNDFAASFNGGAEVTDTSGTMPTVDRIMIGRSQAGEYLNGPIRRIVGWTQSIQNLQELTR